ncbi:MAG: leucine-rich repeat domain-containing protein [Emticicia sp.]
MKKYFYTCLVAFGFVMACSSRTIEIDPNIVVIPDSNFEKALIAQKIDSDNTINGQILKSDTEGVTILSLPKLQIKSLIGIESFKSLTYLDCSLNQIDNLDISQNSFLESLDCSSNLLTNVDLSKNLNLSAFNCINNQLKSLTIPSKQLYALNASNNLLATVSVDAASRLSILNLSNNQIKTLNLINNIALLELKCNNNKLATIDLSKNTKLRILEISNNILSALDLCNNSEILKLICSSNNISKITIPTKIQAMFINKTAEFDSKTSYSTCE